MPRPESVNASGEQIELSAAASTKGATIIYLTTLGREKVNYARTRLIYRADGVDGPQEMERS